MSDNELNDLLGQDSDDEEQMEVVAVEPKKDESDDAELNALLGGSDDEASEERKTDREGAYREGTEEGKEEGEAADEAKEGDTDVKFEFNELDQLLGKKEVKAGKAVKQRTQAKLVVPSSYRVGTSDSAMFVRTPNFIKIQTAEFDESLHDPQAEREAFQGTTAVLRWRARRDEQGELVGGGGGARESNARLVIFDDGSMQMVVGKATFVCKPVEVENW
ncbi:Leo1-like protein-domain-containing protein [Ochromonadaceae sp. CCMP2298]|nr:Leo1-like protein-domain-containing protein [Ochromonadaceae sp. CCMP2298]